MAFARRGLYIVATCDDSSAREGVKFWVSAVLFADDCALLFNSRADLVTSTS